MSRSFRPVATGITVLLTCGILGSASPAFAEKVAKLGTDDKVAVITVIDDKVAGTVGTDDKVAGTVGTDDKVAGTVGTDDKVA
jgi:hypothetical protein